MPIRGTRLAHDARQGGAHKVPPFFSDRPSRMPVCGVCSEDALGEPWWIRRVVTRCHLASRGAGEPRKHMDVSRRRVRFYLQRDTPVRVDITVGSVDSSQYSRCTTALPEKTRCEIPFHAAFKFRWVLTRVNKSTRCITLPTSFDRSI